MMNTTTNGIVIREDEIRHLNSQLDVNTIFCPVVVKPIEDYECFKLDGAYLPCDKVKAIKDLASFVRFRMELAIQNYREGRIEPFSAPRNVGKAIFSDSIYPTGLRISEYVWLATNLAPEMGSRIASPNEHILDVTAQMEEALSKVTKYELWERVLEETSRGQNLRRILRDDDGRISWSCGFSFFGGLTEDHPDPVIYTPSVILRSGR